MWFIIGAGIGLIALVLAIYGLCVYFLFEKLDEEENNDVLY